MIANIPRKSSLPSLFAVAALGLAAFSLSGCSLQTTATPSPVTLPAMRGTVMGGETPIAGSNLILWETDPGDTGYGVTAQQLETATGSTPGGSFSFTTGYTCDPSDFVYVTSTGGDVTDGSGTPMYNPNLVLVAALGSCSNFANAAAQGSVNVIVNELTTVAAAYALGNFASVNANGGIGTQLVYIGAPEGNNANGICAGTGASMFCTAAGLAHAFANAANLVSASNIGGNGGPSGQAYQTVPGNSLGSVPQAEIDTLGNIVQYCTNSGNSISTSSAVSTQCSTLFGDATTPTGSTPTDTFSALINIAHFPMTAPGSSCTGTSGGLFCLASGTGAAFVPALTKAPHDWSLAIYYSGASNLTPSSFGSPQFATLDADDNVYIITGNAYNATADGLAAMTSSGAGLWANPESSQYCVSGTLATDTNGYVWESVDASTSGACSYSIYAFPVANGGGGTPTYELAPGSSTVCGTASPTSATCPGFPSTGYDTTHAIQSTDFGLSFDRFNNLWYDRKSSTCTNCLFSLPYNAGSPGTYSSMSVEEDGYPLSPSTEIYGNEGGQILVDSNSNVWWANQGTGSASVLGGVNVLPNTGTSTAPVYISQLSASPAIGYASAQMNGEEAGGLGLDSAGNVWSAAGTGSTGIYEFTATLGSTPSLTPSASSPMSTTASHPYYSEVDGLGTFFFPSLTASGDIFYQITPSSPNYSTTAANNAAAFQPCYAPAGATACSATASSGDPKSFNIDSTGSIWIANGVSSSSATGFVTQIIGTAAPTWPQMSYGVFGTRPQ